MTHPLQRILQAKFVQAKIERALGNPEIARHRGQIATVTFDGGDDGGDSSPSVSRATMAIEYS